MKKQLIALIMVLFLIIIGFSGCLEEKKDNKDDSKDQIIEEVIITTDKTEYEQGNKIQITIKNTLDSEITFTFSSWGVEYKIHDNWYKISNILGIPEEAMRPYNTKAKAGETLVQSWDGRFWEDFDYPAVEGVDYSPHTLSSIFNSTLLSSYRLFLYYQTLDLEQKKVYSNEFRINFNTSKVSATLRALYWDYIENGKESFQIAGPAGPINISLHNLEVFIYTNMELTEGELEQLKKVGVNISDYFPFNESIYAVTISISNLPEISFLPFVTKIESAWDYGWPEEE